MKASKRLVTSAQDAGGFLMESLSEDTCQKYRSTDIDDRQALDEMLNNPTCTLAAAVHRGAFASAEYDSTLWRYASAVHDSVLGGRALGGWDDVRANVPSPRCIFVNEVSLTND